jgi:peptidoglycan/LPS O-acetylase OafA/YrhL
MRSSSGQHFIALDHVRAFAAFMVFVWHFTHSSNGYPVPFDYAPSFIPFALLDEGHSGVALFMTLSGYLFAKLLDGRSVNFASFLWNRALRLLPLLALVMALALLQAYATGADTGYLLSYIARGWLYPTLPNGGWSITVEFHYYLILPLLLWLFRKSSLLPLLLVVSVICLRFALHQMKGQIQFLSYWTILGRIDQFVLGMLAYHYGALFTRRHLIALGTLSAFMLFYWYFDRLGGFASYGSYPSPARLWVIMPTLEGIAYAIGIVWYDTSFVHKTTGLSGFIGRIGEYSYSIYLFHFFVVFAAARFVHENLMDISNFYLACAWASVCFLLMLPLGYLSFRYLESPFLKLRRNYLRPMAPPD